MINIRNTGKTLVLGTQGTKIASAGLKGRVFEASSADLRKDEVAFRKFKLVPKDVQGKNCLTHFHGLDRACDEICSMVKKKTTDCDRSSCCWQDYRGLFASSVLRWFL